VELAERIGLPLATYDQRVLDEFPSIAKRPASLIE